MAPTPADDIDLPALRDKILDLLRELWKFVTDVCRVIWSHICYAFWGVWTYPPFESFRNEFVAALVALKDYVIAHPVTTVAIIILFFIVVPGVLSVLQQFVLHCLGFRRRGVLRGSYAANYQSTGYGGNVQRGSTFAWSQSQGAKGAKRYRTTSPSWD